MTNCSSCLEDYDDSLEQCPHCGYSEFMDLDDEFDNYCPVCNDPISFSWIFCPGCGTSID